MFIFFQIATRNRISAVLQLTLAIMLTAEVIGNALLIPDPMPGITKSFCYSLNYSGICN